MRAICVGRSGIQDAPYVIHDCEFEGYISSNDSALRNLP